jgi:hypothetical protein
MELSRRSVLAAAALTATGCARKPAPGPSPAAGSALADAHVHLFNGADLPAGRFAQYVALPEMFPDLPPYVDALADVALNVLQKLAIPAVRETIRTGGVGSAAPDISPEAFGQAIEARIRAVAPADQGLMPASPAPLAESYRALTELLGRDPSLAPAGVAPNAVAPGAARADVAAAGRQLFTETARQAGQPNGLVPAAAAPGDTNPFVKRLIAWIYQMLQSRQHHLARYLADYSPPGATPRLLINHLVDYTYWLGAGPVPGSEIAQQVSFWAAVAQARKDTLDLRTFGPFCPLRHAIETARGAPTSLAALKAAYAAGQVAGVKLYPPMGFQPIGNAQIKDGWTGPGGLNGEFTSPPGKGLGRIAVDAWEAAAGKVPLGPALDAAMVEFLSWARADDVPMMAHAGFGNSPSAAFRSRANPLWWEKAAGPARDLRISLGHLVMSPQAFIDAGRDYLAGKPLDPNKPEHWAFDAPIRMLRPANGQPGRAYADLAYMPALAGDAALAKTFCEVLKATFGQADPDLAQVLYGTDWIMFALEADSAAFPETLRRGMRDAGFSDAAIENISWKNARRFLKLPPA